MGAGSAVGMRTATTRSASGGAGGDATDGALGEASGAVAGIRTAIACSCATGLAAGADCAVKLLQPAEGSVRAFLGASGACMVSGHGG